MSPRGSRHRTPCRCHVWLAVSGWYSPARSPPRPAPRVMASMVTSLRARVVREREMECVRARAHACFPDRHQWAERVCGARRHQRGDSPRRALRFQQHLPLTGAAHLSRLRRHFIPHSLSQVCTRRLAVVGSALPLKSAPL